MNPVSRPYITLTIRYQVVRESPVNQEKLVVLSIVAYIRDMERFIRDISRLLSDHASGSGDLLAALIRSVSDLAGRQGQEGDIDAVRVTRQLTMIREEKPVFLVLHHFISGMLDLLVSKNLIPASEVTAFLENYQSRWGKVNELIALKFLEQFDPDDRTILLHSNSSTVCAILGAIPRERSRIRIIQTESRPVMEGRKQAAHLAGLGYPVTVITDASIARYMERIDIAVLGADAVLQDHFLNKTGSHLITLACREHGKPCLVVCDSRKLWLNQDESFRLRTIFEHPAPPEEIWDSPPQQVKIENYCFEKIPCGLVNSFVFEDLAIPGKRLKSVSPR